MARCGQRSPRRELELALRSLVWPDGQARRGGLVYDGPAAFVLEHGEWFEPRPLDRGLYRPGLAGHCFHNAIHAAIVYGLDYVEGYGLHSGMPIHHAWNVDAEGGLVDTTWGGEPALIGRTLYTSELGRAYVGVRFSPERADDCTWNGDASILDDWRRRWPLLAHRWEGEPAGKVWPPSPRIESIRLLRDGRIEEARALWEQMEAAERSSR